MVWHRLHCDCGATLGAANVTATISDDHEDDLQAPIQVLESASSFSTFTFQRALQQGVDCLKKKALTHNRMYGHKLSCVVPLGPSDRICN